jgi:hypothetical protein
MEDAKKEPYKKGYTQKHIRTQKLKQALYI